MSRQMPAYRRHATGQAYVRTKRLNGGKNVYLGVYGSPESHRRYKSVIERLATLAEHTATPAPMHRDPTIADIINVYTDWAIEYYRGAQEYREMVYALQPLYQLHADTVARTFGPAELEQVQQRMVLQGLARTTINHRIGRVRRMFRWAVRYGHVPVAVYQALMTLDGLRRGRTEARESPPVKPVPFTTVQATLPFLSPTVATMVQVQLACAMRSQDVCLMRPADIDTSGEVWLYRPHKFKTQYLGHQRVIAIPPAARQLIAPLLDREPLRYLFEPAEAAKWRRPRPGRKTPIYPSELRARERRRNKSMKFPRRCYNECYSKNSYGRAIRHAIAAASKRGTSIPHWHPHQLRHTMATLIAQKLGAQQAQRYLGHARLEATEIYAAFETSELVTIAKSLEQHLPVFTVSG